MLPPCYLTQDSDFVLYHVYGLSDITHQSVCFIFSGGPSLFTVPLLWSSPDYCRLVYDTHDDWLIIWLVFV